MTPSQSRSGLCLEECAARGQIPQARRNRTTPSDAQPDKAASDHGYGVAVQVYRIRRSAAAGLTLFGVPVILMTALAVVQLPRLSWIDLAPVLVFAVWYV